MHSSPTAPVLHQPAGPVPDTTDGQPGVCQVLPEAAGLYTTGHAQEI